MVCLVLTGHAQSLPPNARNTDPHVEAFVAELQRASRTGDRDAVAALIHYPVTVMIGGIRVPFADADALLERYDAIFTPELQDAIDRAATATAIGDSVVIGTNALVANRIGERLKITEIYVPPPDPAGISTSTGREAAPTVRRPEPRRIGVRAGRRPTQFSGSLAPSGTDVYTMWIERGKVLQVRLERAPSGAALVRVVHAATEAPLNPRNPNPARVVTGIAPQSGDYRIEVRRTASADTAPLPYMLSVTLR